MFVEAQSVRRIFPVSHSASANFPYMATVSDADPDSVWNAGNVGPQWIQVDLGSVKNIAKVRLLVCQYPPGITNHIVTSSATSNLPTEPFGTFNGYTSDSQWLDVLPAASPTSARYIRITTTSAASWICWRTIEIYEAVTDGSDPCPNAATLAFGADFSTAYDSNLNVRCYTINAAIGDRINLTTRVGAYLDGSSAFYYPSGSTTLFSPSNSIVEYGSFSGFGPPETSSAINYVVPQSGTYKVKVQINAFRLVYTRLTLASLNNYVTTSGFVQATSTNVALASAGASAVASSTYPYGDYSPRGAIDGNRKGNPWGGNAGWNDYTVNQTPDWFQVNFAGEKIIDTINVFSLQDAWLSPSEPTGSMTFSNFGLIDFDVQYWLVSVGGWVTVPGGAIRGNNKVWKSIWFPPAATSSIRIVVYRAGDGFTRLAEVEAWTAGARDPSNTRWGPPPGPKPPEPPLPLFPSQIF